MGDLISRQALLNELEHDLACFETENKSEKEMYISISDMRRMIEGQKTAYDVNKVVKQMKAAKNKFNGMLDIARNSAIDRNIEIVKAGEVHEQS